MNEWKQYMTSERASEEKTLFISEYIWYVIIVPNVFYILNVTLKQATTTRI